MQVGPLKGLINIVCSVRFETNRFISDIAKYFKPYRIQKKIVNSSW